MSEPLPRSDELITERQFSASMQDELEAFRTHHLAETSRLTREVLELRADNERLRAAVAPLLKEVIQLRDGLLHPKQGRAIAPDEDSLHWEGVTPVDPCPSEGDKWLAVQWSKVIVPVQQALATPAPVVPKEPPQ